MKEICMTGLYKCAPVLEWLPASRRSDPYYCMNWTFRPAKSSDGKIQMVDTYYGDKSIEVTEENRDLFELVFDFNDVNLYGRTSPAENGYKEEDYYRVAIGSGSMTERKYFLKKGAKPDEELLLANLLRDYERKKSELVGIVFDIERLTKQEYPRSWSYEITENTEGVLHVLAQEDSFQSAVEAYEKACTVRDESHYWYGNIRVFPSK